MADTDSPTPEAAFAALGNEHRVAILETLVAAAEDGERTLTFSELYNRVDVGSSPQFAYHLDKLDGLFVVASEDGYRLTQAGEKVARAVRSGVYNERPSFEPTAVDGACPHCDATELLASFREPLLTVSCEDCDRQLVSYNLPPGQGPDREPMAVLRAADRQVRHEYAAAVDGVCPECGGTTDVAVHEKDAPDPGTQYAVVTCRTCGLRVFAPVGVRLLSHPSVVAFYWERGVDVTAVPLWSIHSVLDEWETTVTRTDPLELRVVVSHEGDELRLSVDETLAVSPLNA
ncbi:ArsR family transcriptional regulator [Halobacteriaceae archaeon GCM10025711]